MALSEHSQSPNNDIVPKWYCDEISDEFVEEKNNCLDVRDSRRKQMNIPPENKQLVHSIEQADKNFRKMMNKFLFILIIIVSILYFKKRRF